MGDWGLGTGDWGLGIGKLLENSPILPISPIPFNMGKFHALCLNPCHRSLFWRNNVLKLS
ncbi:hypothetical protein Cal7507_5947 [Calothrix sp. PCC 7507]|nr:hypothetical protein Cal7507_5947 [Calothrix sp. PCC 7507]